MWWMETPERNMMRKKQSYDEGSKYEEGHFP